METFAELYAWYPDLADLITGKAPTGWFPIHVLRVNGSIPVPAEQLLLHLQSRIGSARVVLVQAPFRANRRPIARFTLATFHGMLEALGLTHHP